MLIFSVASRESLSLPVLCGSPAVFFIFSKRGFPVLDRGSQDRGIHKCADNNTYKVLSTKLPQGFINNLPKNGGRPGFYVAVDSS